VLFEMDADAVGYNEQILSAILQSNRPRRQKPQAFMFYLDRCFCNHSSKSR
jgi:hypothetical protein